MWRRASVAAIGSEGESLHSAENDSDPAGQLVNDWEGTMAMTLRCAGPHRGQPVSQAGVALDAARSAMVLVHGRGDTAAGILQLADVLPVQGMAYFAPQASAQTWYPNRFLAPIEANQPWLSSGLDGLGDLLEQIAAAGVPAERTVLLGFSQGGCLALEFAVRNPRRYGALVGLSAGLIGPPGTSWPRAGSLEGTPVFLGCSDMDAHIPASRVRESAVVLREIGGDVAAVLYPGIEHTVTEDEVRRVQRLIAPLGDRSDRG
jgi:predicted esterase